MLKLVERARSGMPFAANSVMQELALFLMMEEAEFLMDTMSLDMEAAGVENLDICKEWIFDFFGDMDIITCF